ncbi:type IV pilus modification protein PilV [Endozoicomonas montiporae]|uniref:Type IV fimbrial biogenesis protein PilV n=1 Tax=Endozoicomonas montiporae CL-33 TaxID=570277 RepID=A0A142BAD2_9GAMM|nr:type IV pilus modification protein PilV [Endozoicomonas montiporae]AMO55708.1 type IV fimbrial biogenesis protein PilV [Endozoicomonas montiporae CL-33]
MPVSKRSYNRSSGVGLIEVLAAMLIISIGVLGIVGLQTKSLQHNQMAYLRSQAVIIGNDMMDRIRVNRSLSSVSDNYVVELEQLTTDRCEPEAYPDGCESGSCTPAELAEYDIRQWKFQLACLLPDSDGSIAIEASSSGRIYVITMQFDESRGQQPVREVVIRSAL